MRDVNMPPHLLELSPQLFFIDIHLLQFITILPPIFNKPRTIRDGESTIRDERVLFN